jgi:hypothetical protein
VPDRIDENIPLGSVVEHEVRISCNPYAPVSIFVDAAAGEREDCEHLDRALDLLEHTLRCRWIAFLEIRFDRSLRSSSARGA